MWDWLKKNISIIVTSLIVIGFMIFIWACEPKVHSLVDKHRLVNRQELQLELDQLIGLTQLRMADLDKQEELRSIILQNALILVQGSPVNPVGIITGIAAIYGLTQGGCNITKVVKSKCTKRKGNNA